MIETGVNKILLWKTLLGFEFLRILAAEAGSATSDPADWMPWNYRNICQQTGAP